MFVFAFLKNCCKITVLVRFLVTDLVTLPSQCWFARFVESMRRPYNDRYSTATRSLCRPTVGVDRYNKRSDLWAELQERTLTGGEEYGNNSLVVKCPSGTLATTDCSFKFHVGGNLSKVDFYI